MPVGDPEEVVVVSALLQDLTAWVPTVLALAITVCLWLVVAFRRAGETLHRAEMLLGDTATSEPTPPAPRAHLATAGHPGRPDAPALGVLSKPTPLSATVDEFAAVAAPLP